MASSSARSWNERRDAQSNSAGETAKCERCGASGNHVFVRMSIRVIPHTMKVDRERLCSACRGHAGFYIEETARRLPPDARTLIPSLGGDGL